MISRKIWASTKYFQRNLPQKKIHFLFFWHFLSKFGAQVCHFHWPVFSILFPVLQWANTKRKKIYKTKLTLTLTLTVLLLYFISKQIGLYQYLIFHFGQNNDEIHIYRQRWLTVSAHCISPFMPSFSIKCTKHTHNFI